MEYLSGDGSVRDGDTVVETKVCQSEPTLFVFKDLSHTSGACGPPAAGAVNTIHLYRYHSARLLSPPFLPEVFDCRGGRVTSHYRAEDDEVDTTGLAGVNDGLTLLNLWKGDKRGHGTFGDEEHCAERGGTTD